MGFRESSLEGLVTLPVQPTTTPPVQSVVSQDLDYICGSLEEEFAALAGRRILITGGAGFLGYYLVQSLVHYNKSGKGAPIAVTVFDNYARGVPGWLTATADKAHVELVKHDVRQPLPAGMEDFHYLIHAASIASPKYYRKFPIETMDANVNGLRTLLDYGVAQQAKGRPIDGFLYFSSSEIYGDPPPEYIPTPETYRGNVSCTGPRACYDESKRYGETLSVNFAQQHGLPVKTARPFNNYGPGLKITDSRVIPDFMRDVFAARDIVMYSDGSPTRTFCYIADAVIGYFRILIRGRPGEAYNIGVDKPEISMTDLAGRIVALAGEHLNYRGRVVHRRSSEQAYLVDNPNRRCPDIGKARSELSYEPSVNLDEGLKRSLYWYAAHQSAEEA